MDQSPIDHMFRCFFDYQVCALLLRRDRIENRCCKASQHPEKLLIRDKFADANFTGNALTFFPLPNINEFRDVPIKQVGFLGSRNAGVLIQKQLQPCRSTSRRPNNKDLIHTLEP